MAFAFIKHDTKIDFIGKRHIAYVISILLLLVGLGSALWGNGLRMGIDFAGGVIVQVQFAQPVEDEVLKKSLDVPELASAPSASVRARAITCCASPRPRTPMPRPCAPTCWPPWPRPSPAMTWRSSALR